MSSNDSNSAKAWEIIEKGKRYDRLVRGASMFAWGISVVSATIFTGLSVAQLVLTSKQMLGRNLPTLSLVVAAQPAVLALTLVALLVAAFGTINIFLRLRTANLAEIQLRLAALEDLLTARPDKVRD